MIACLATALHKLPREVEAITVGEAEALFVYWERTPPPHVSLALLLAAQTTWKPKEPFHESTPDDLAAFAAASGITISTRK